MTYPQSGSGYGQGDAGSQGYGQPQYGQQAGYQAPGAYAQQAAQYGQQSYGQDQYGQQAQYGQQQYGDQYQQAYGQQYGYQQPAKAPSQGLPANTKTILAGVVGGLGIVMLFLGFLAGFSATNDGVKMGGTTLVEPSSYSIKLFATPYATPWALLAVAGVVALGTFLLGFEKWVASVVLSLTAISALSTVFMFATFDDNGIGAILLLVFSILALIAAVVWALVEGEILKLAPEAPAAAATADPSAAAYGYGSYGQPAAEQQAAAPAYGQQTAAPSYQAPAAQPSAGDYQPTQYGQQAQDAAASQPAPSFGQTEIVQPGTPATGSDATTAFPKPESEQQ